MKVLASAATWWVCVSYSGLVRASGEQVRFSWVRAEGADLCASQEIIEDRVRHRLGRDPFSPGARRSIEGIVSRGNGRWNAVLFVRGEANVPAGSRSLDSDAGDCLALEDASILAIALAIDPDEALRPPAETAPVSEPSAPALPQPVPPPPPLVPPQEPLPVTPPVVSGPNMVVPAPAERGSGPGRSGSLTVRGVGALGLLPQFSLGVAWSGILPAKGPWAFFSGVLWLVEQADATGTAAFGLTSAWLGSCYRPSPGVLAFRLCGSAHAGAIHSVALRYSPIAPGDRAWGALALEPALVWEPTQAISLEAGLSGMAPLVRHHFAIAGTSSDLFQQAPITLGAFLGLGLRFR